MQVLAQQATQREAAEKWGVDRSTVVSICKTAKQGALDAPASARPGRSGKTAEQAELDEAKAEIERLRATVTEQAVSLHLHEGKSRWDRPPARSRPAWTRPSRPGLLKLVAHAQAEGGWSLRKAAHTLGLEHVRVLRWLDRAAQDPAG